LTFLGGGRFTNTAFTVESGSGKYVVIINLGATARIIMMNKIPNSTNVVI
jgi:hypothetical protein